MKNNLSYYPRRSDSHRHPKMKLLRVKYGRDGRDKFWHLCDLIAEADNCFLDVSNTINKASIAEDLEFTISELDEFIEFLHKDCQLIILEKKRITTQTAQDTLAEVMKDRKGARERYDKGKTPTSGENVKTSPEKQKTSPENLYKLNEIKENESKEVKPKKVFAPPSLLEFQEYFLENGFKKEVGERAWRGYDVAGWQDSRGNPVKNWKQKCQNVWFKDENKQIGKPNNKTLTEDQSKALFQ